MLVGGATLLASHLLALPSPEPIDPRLNAAIAALPTSADHWRALHFVYEECKCSQRVVARLLERGAMSDVAERIVFVGKGDAIGASATARGFQFESVSNEALRDQYGVEGAPLLVISDPQGHVRYVGGYTEHKQDGVVKDLELMTRVRSGEVVSPLPLFGCAVSEQLQKKIDPLGITR